MYKILSTSGLEPITLAEVKEWIRIDSDITRYNNVLTDLIEAARIEFERASGISLMVHTVDLRIKYEDLRNAFLRLALNPDTITSVKYLDEDGVFQTILSTTYVLDKVNRGLILLDDFPLHDEYQVIYVTEAKSDKMIEIAIKRILKDSFDYSDNPTRAKKTAVDRVVKLARQWVFK